jgi:hypothetical protein
VLPCPKSLVAHPAARIFQQFTAEPSTPPAGFTSAPPIEAIRHERYPAPVCGDRRDRRVFFHLVIVVVLLIESATSENKKDDEDALVPAAPR